MSEVPPPKRTITFLDEDELQIYKLYRERVVQEDNLINHRMLWLIASQAFLLAIWGVLFQKTIENNNHFLISVAREISIIGIAFCVGSLFSIKAAQDQIALLRKNYLVMFPPKETPDDKINKSCSTLIQTISDIIHSIIVYLLPSQKQIVPQPNEVEALRQKLRLDPLAGLTGLRDFHKLGHIVPKYMPVMIILLWLFLLFGKSTITPQKEYKVQYHPSCNGYFYHPIIISPLGIIRI